jgi:hypothetical protein
MRKTYCYICKARLWGKVPMPDTPGFTMGHCYKHGWVPDHKGLQIAYHSWFDSVIEIYYKVLKCIDACFGFLVWISHLRK